MKYKAAYYTDVGIKKKNNQDSLAIKIAETPKGSAVFAIICDGMGGLAKGELASKEVICAYCDWFEKDFPELVLSGTFNASILKQQWDMIAINENEKLKSIRRSTGDHDRYHSVCNVDVWRTLLHYPCRRQSCI